jgi:hypothetical protein
VIFEDQYQNSDRDTHANGDFGAGGKIAALNLFNLRICDFSRDEGLVGNYDETLFVRLFDVAFKSAVIAERYFSFR